MSDEFIVGASGDEAAPVVYPKRVNRPHPNLRALAEQAMRARGFLVGVPTLAEKQLDAEAEPAFNGGKLVDLTSWLWSSIDNDESKDLDQIEFAKQEANGIRLYVGIADVDWFVPSSSPLDVAALQNTTSVYTGIETFPMLPDKLSTNLSSLNQSGKRLAIVIEMLVGHGPDPGAVLESSVYPAIVENKAQLTYNAVAAWLDNQPLNDTTGTLQKIRSSTELQTQLKLQDAAAALLRERRHEAGALSFHTTDLQPITSPEGTVIDLQTRRQNRASYLIEDLMIAANQATAAFLEGHRSPSVSRIVRDPERWDRIVAIAASLGATLSPEPDARSLEAFLKQQQAANPLHFPDLSLAIIKLLGRGEYVVKQPGDDATGHFGLAVRNYSHSTAPNRRYADLITQRLLKAVFAGKAVPYKPDELNDMAKHCTEREDAANRVERFVKKCAAAMLLITRIGEVFDAVVSGISADGMWVRVSNPVVEGKLLQRLPHMDVGHRLRVRLVSVDPEKGFIDFEPA
jgi:exoribonuclease-2